MQRLIGVFILILSFAMGWFWMDYKDSLTLTSSNDEAVLFEIQKGESLADIANSLNQRGLLQKPRWFRLTVYLNHASGKLKYGEYAINPRMTPNQMIELFVSGKVYQHALTFIEGWNFKQMLDSIDKNPAIAHKLEGQSDDALLKSIGASYSMPEGLFFPDTYFFTKGISDIELLKRAHQKMQSLLTREWQGRAEGLPLQNAYEALILASIVEKETALSEERAMVSGVFIRRLQKHMKLQTDPTVIYGMGDRYLGNIRKEDLLADTVYNTYVHHGLPPTPISMPSIGSIHAALHPDASENLYFVSRGDGSHVFSKDLNEHNKAVEQFQLNRHGRSAAPKNESDCARRFPHLGPLPEGEGDSRCSLQDLLGNSHD